MLFSPHPLFAYFVNTIVGHSPLAEKVSILFSSVLFLCICQVACRQCGTSGRFVNHLLSGSCSSELPSFHEQPCRSKAGRNIMNTLYHGTLSNHELLTTVQFPHEERQDCTVIRIGNHQIYLLYNL